MKNTAAFAPSTEPIKNADDDALGRKAFAERICAALGAWDLTTTSLVVGIDGDWGEGKSSLMTLMKARLELSGYLYREFHPWLFSDEQAMTIEFFRVLHSLIYKSSKLGDVRKKALAKLKEYGPTVLAGGGPVGAAAGKVMEKALAGPSVLEQRKALGNMMSKLTRPVVICAEDIDRLTPSEALRIATLIRLVGSFPNVVYLLPYDRKNFTRLLDLALTQKEPAAGGPASMGEGFRERLVQLDIRLPRASTAELMNLLDRAIAPAIISAGISLDDASTKRALDRFFEMYQLSGVHELFRTPRDATRFAGSLALVLAASGKEVNLLDAMLLEVLRLHVPTAYEAIRLDPQALAGGGSLAEQLSRGLGEGEDARRKRQQGGLLKNLDDRTKEITTRILTELLPQVFGGRSGTAERRRALRFGEPENIERYFHFGLALTDVSYAELATDVEAAVAGNPAPLAALLAGERADSAVLALIDATDLADAELRERMVTALSVVAPELKPTYAAFGYSAWERLALLYGKLLLATDEAKALELITTGPAAFIVYAVRLMDAEKDPRLAPAQSAMRRAAARRIVDVLQGDEMWTAIAPLGMFVAVLAVWQPSTVCDDIVGLITGRPERARMLLASRVNASLKDGPVVMRGASLDFAQLRKEVDPQKLLDIVEADAAKNEEHVALLREAVAASTPVPEDAPTS